MAGTKAGGIKCANTNKEKREGNLIIVYDHFEVESEGYFTIIYRTIDSLHNSGWELV